MFGALIFSSNSPVSWNQQKCEMSKSARVGDPSQGQPESESEKILQPWLLYICSFNFQQSQPGQEFLVAAEYFLLLVPPLKTSLRERGVLFLIIYLGKKRQKLNHLCYVDFNVAPVILILVEVCLVTHPLALCTDQFFRRLRPGK